MLCHDNIGLLSSFLTIYVSSYQQVGILQADIPGSILLNHGKGQVAFGFPETFYLGGTAVSRASCISSTGLSIFRRGSFNEMRPLLRWRQ